MDLNEVPCDVVVDGLKIQEKKRVNYNVVVDKESGYFRIKSNEVEQRCREIEENRLVLELEIRNKEMNLEAIKAKIRVLVNEKVTFEEEIRDLKKKKKKVALEGAEVSDTNGGKLSLNCCEIESAELSRVDQLMVENKVLECEKNMAIKEVEVWKKKCKDLESRVLELEGRLEGKGKDSISIGIKAEEATAMVCDDDCALRDFASRSCMRGAIDGVLPVEDNRCVATECTPTNKVQVKRRLAYPNERNCDEKIAPPTPAGGKSSAASVIDIIDSDNECDVHARHKPNSQSEGYTYMMSENGVHKTDKIMDGVHCEQEQSSGRGDTPSISTPMTKRKRDLMVVTSDDECENNGCTPNRRSLKIENSDNEDEEDADNIKTIRRISKRITSESESDDEDNVPISQLKRSRAHKCSSQIASTSNPTCPRRRLVKYGQAKLTDKAQEVENDPDTLTTGNAANDDLSEEESESSVRSLSSFIVDDSDDENVDDDVSKEDGQDHSSELEEGSDNNFDFEEIISRLQSRRHANSRWTSEGDMLSDFGKNPELCLRAVCALYRQQTKEEKACKASLIHNGRGFSKFDATRGTLLGDFLTDGDSNSDLVKSVEELQVHHRHGLEECRTLADRYSKQLFKIYENEEDPFFP